MKFYKTNLFDKLKNSSAQRGNICIYGMLPPVPWNRVGMHPAVVAQVAAAVNFGIAVQDFLVETLFRNTDSVVETGNRCKITYEYYKLFLVF